MCIVFFGVWYFISDAYFGNELGDLMIIWTILGIALLSLLFTLFKKWISPFVLDLFIIIAVFSDIFMVYLLFNDY
jgi:ABC-type Fe3+-siderophore transport system permease subunit